MCQGFPFESAACNFWHLWQAQSLANKSYSQFQSSNFHSKIRKLKWVLHTHIILVCEMSFTSCFIWKEKLCIYASELELYCLLASFTCNFKIALYCPLQFYSSCHYCILNLVSLCRILEVWFRSSYQGTLNPNCSKHSSNCHGWTPFGKFELVHSLIFFRILQGAQFLRFSPFFVLPIFLYFWTEDLQFF